MRRYHVSGSNMCNACSVDCLAKNDEQAIEIFKEKMGEDLDAFAGDDIIVIDIDKPAIGLLEEPLKWFRSKWKNGRVWKDEY